MGESLGCRTLEFRTFFGHTFQLYFIVLTATTQRYYSLMLYLFDRYYYQTVHTPSCRKSLPNFPVDFPLKNKG